MRGRAFTLIELLIVVAIIAILAAIAVPNFLEAQTRAKVARAKSDIRSAATALEAYRIDWNIYPYDGYYTGSAGTGSHPYNFWFLPIEISTPTAYLTSANLLDPFRTQATSTTHWQIMDVRYVNTGATWSPQYSGLSMRTTPSIYLAAVTQEWGGWYLDSVGPDRYYGPNDTSALQNPTIFPSAMSWPGVSTYPDCVQPYDATNGTTSWGDIIRSQLSPSGYINAH